MNKELLGAQEGMAEEGDAGYGRYRELGGIINGDDYRKAVERLNYFRPDATAVKQAENMAKFAGIELGSVEDEVDDRIKLYAILRSDVRSDGIKNHHDQMSDQQIFAEALRMLGDAESVDKMIKTYPNINFRYNQER